jgi:hypothetical protein
MLVGYDNQDIIEIPPNVKRIFINYNAELILGNYQDRSADRLIVYKKNLQTNTIDLIRMYQKTLETEEPNTYYLYTRLVSYEIRGELDAGDKSIVKFVDGEIPFYYWKDSLYNRKHEKICDITKDFIAHLMSGEIYKISEERCLFWKSGILLSLYFDGQMITFQGSSLEIPQSDMLVSNILINTFEVNDKIINELKALLTFEEAVKYLGSQLTFDVIVKERQNNGEKIRVMRS